MLRWWVARLCVPIALILRSQIGCQLIISRRWLTEFTQVSPIGSPEIAPILLLCCPVCQVFMFSVPILQLTSHTHTPICMRGVMYSSLSPVILRFVCSEDTQRGGLEPSYFWVVLGPHLLTCAKLASGRGFDLTFSMGYCEWLICYALFHICKLFLYSKLAKKSF